MLLYSFWFNNAPFFLLLRFNDPPSLCAGLKNADSVCKLLPYILPLLRNRGFKGEQETRGFMVLSVRNRRSLLSSLNLSISFLRSEYFSLFYYLKKKACVYDLCYVIFNYFYSDGVIVELIRNVRVEEYSIFEQESRKNCLNCENGCNNFEREREKSKRGAIP